MPDDYDSDDLSGYSEADPNMLSVQIQQRIARLKKVRDNRMDIVLQDSKQALDDLRARVIDYRIERRKKQSQVYAAHVMKLIEATERRMEIETKMTNLTKELFSATNELERMMLKGYEGRGEDIKRHREMNESSCG